MNFVKKYHFGIFLFSWTLINFFQAANTVLLNDEAYYWVYSNFLDWGYFDHPPIIAALIKSGYFLSKTELGVRFFIVILNTLTLVILYQLLTKKNPLLFYAIAASIALIQLGGFIAAPDIPLAFFVALFFLVYKKFIQSFSWLQTILLGIVMGLMLYSKYHGVLVIFFTIASNPSLLKNKKAYFAVAIGVLLFTPHLYWQYLHGFPSVQYHLFERNETYKVLYTIEYILGQLLLAGPFMGWLFMVCAFRYKTTNLSERALQFSMVGIYVFFFISSLKGPVETNWTVPAIIPLIVLSHQYLTDKKQWQRILYRSVPVTLLAVFFIRFYLIADNKFITFLNTNEFEQNSAWAKKIKNLTGDVPVVFINSYQKASKYWFYSGVTSFSLNTPAYRRNNYNYWPLENSMQGKTVYVMAVSDAPFFTDSVQTTAGILHGKRIDSFYSYSAIQLKAEAISFDNEKKLVVKVKETATELKNFMHLQLFIYKENEFVTSVDLLPGKNEKSSQTFISSTAMLLAKGNYYARLAIASCMPGYPSLNSTNIKFSIK